MATYKPPIGNSILFNFSEGGYIPPDFLNINFKSIFSNTSDLQSSINILQLYTDSTYTFVKSCRKIIVGYSEHGVQVLELPCAFGGIRDISSYISVTSSASNFLDISAILRARQTSHVDIFTKIRASGIGFFDLYSYIKGLDFLDLQVKVRSLHKSTYNLSSLLNTVPPFNLSAFLNIIEVRDLISTLEGVYFKGVVDLPIDFGRVTLKYKINLFSHITGWDTKNLIAYIGSARYFDLEGSIFSGFFKIQKNIAAYLLCIPPKDLGAFLHGYDTLNLNAFSIIGYQPNDLPAYINTTTPKDIIAYVYGLKAQNVFTNLQAVIHGFLTMDLNAYISTIAAKDLLAFIVATGKYLDLKALIVPKTINIKRVLSVSLYEHKNLRATINYNCLKSNFKDLLVSIYPIKRLDLKAYIIGWYGDKADNLLDLKAYINNSDYQDTDFNSLLGNIYFCTTPFVTHKISFTSNTTRSKYKVFDTNIINGLYSSHMLSAFIRGELQSRDLSCTIEAKPIANFTTVPSWVNPKTYEVIINLNRFEERWYRFVELMFFTNSDSDYHFFYVPEDNKVYKVSRNRTWKIQVLGFSDDSESIYSRVKINKKLLFKLDNYSTFDEALRDFIDRVSLKKSSDLSAIVNCYTYPHYDISASIRVIKRRTWTLSCKAVIKCAQRDLMDFTASIEPEINHDTNNLTALIVGKYYEPPNSNNIKFVFDIDTYVPPGSYNNMNWNYIQAEKFWKE